MISHYVIRFQSSWHMLYIIFIHSKYNLWSQHYTYFFMTKNTYDLYYASLAIRPLHIMGIIRSTSNIIILMEDLLFFLNMGYCIP